MRRIRVRPVPAQKIQCRLAVVDDHESVGDLRFPKGLLGKAHVSGVVLHEQDRDRSVGRFGSHVRAASGFLNGSGASPPRRVAPQPYREAIYRINTQLYVRTSGNTGTTWGSEAT